MLNEKEYRLLEYIRNESNRRNREKNLNNKFFLFNRNIFEDLGITDQDEIDYTLNKLAKDGYLICIASDNRKAYSISVTPEGKHEIGECKRELKRQSEKREADRQQAEIQKKIKFAKEEVKKEIEQEQDKIREEKIYKMIDRITYAVAKFIKHITCGFFCGIIFYVFFLR